MEFSKFAKYVTFWPYFEEARESARVARQIRESTKLSECGGRAAEGAGERRTGGKGALNRGSGTQSDAGERRGCVYAYVCVCVWCVHLLCFVYVPKRMRSRRQTRIDERGSARGTNKTTVRWTHSLSLPRHAPLMHTTDERTGCNYVSACTVSIARPVRRALPTNAHGYRCAAPRRAARTRW